MPPATPLFFSLSIDLLYRKAYIIVKKEKMPLEQKPKYTKTVRVSELVRDIKSGDAPESFNSLIDKIMNEGAKRRLTEFKHEGRTVKFDWTDNPKDPLLTFEAEVHPLDRRQATRSGKAGPLARNASSRVGKIITHRARIIASPRK